MKVSGRDNDTNQTAKNEIYNSRVVQGLRIGNRLHVSWNDFCCIRFIFCGANNLSKNRSGVVGGSKPVQNDQLGCLEDLEGALAKNALTNQ